jgi:hypothetical protein
MPAAIREAYDPYEPAVWVASRVPRWQPLVKHEKFRVILGMLLSGRGPWRTADWIRANVPANDALGVDKLSRLALARRLQRFQKALPDRVGIAATFLDEKFVRVDVDLDEIAEIDGLIRYQKFRLGILGMKEADFGVPVEQQGREVDRLANLLVRRKLLLDGVMNVTQQTVGQQVNVVVQQSEAASSVAGYLRDNPAAIPKLMSLFDDLEPAVVVIEEETTT